MERYRRQQSELHYTKEGKRRLAEAITGTDRTRAPQPRRRLRIAAVIAAALALTVSAGALSPGIRGMLSDALGGFGEYAQEVQAEEVVDQGIALKVISALADSHATVVYAQARDLNGDRLKGEMQITGVLQAQDPAPGYGVVSHAECVGYDEETGAALLKFVSISSQPKAGTEAVDCQLIVFDLQPQQYAIEELPLPNELLTGETLRSFRPAEEEIVPDGSTEAIPDPVVLEPGQTPADLGSELVALSSLGFAEDGRLHILLEVPAEAVPSGSTLLSTLRSRYLESLDDDSVAPEMSNEYYERYNDPLLPGVWFTRDGGLYYDMSFPAGPEALDDLLLETLYGAVSLAEPIRGRWTVPLTVETAPESRMPLQGPLDGTEAILSPLSLILHTEWSADKEDAFKRSAADCFACLRDGSRIEGKSWGSAGMTGEFISRQWLFEQPVDLEQLTEITVGDWIIPIVDGVAEEAYS